MATRPDEHDTTVTGAPGSWRPDRLGLAAYGIARLGFGTVLSLAPGVTGAWLGEAAAEPRARMLVRLVGVRDGLLGAAAVGAAQRDSASAVHLSLAGALADVADLVVTVAGRRQLPRTARAVVVVAALGAGTGLALAGAAARTDRTRASDGGAVR